MSKKRFSAEQIVTLLRQIEVLMAQGKLAEVGLIATAASTLFWPMIKKMTVGVSCVDDGGFCRLICRALDLSEVVYDLSY
jgi:hypothetical protein